jgi:hypothetical protein
MEGMVGIYSSTELYTYKSGTQNFQPHERIVASAIYYYDTDSAIHDEGLSLRRVRHEGSDFPTRAGPRHEVSSIYFCKRTFIYLRRIYNQDFNVTFLKPKDNDTKDHGKGEDHKSIGGDDEDEDEEDRDVDYPSDWEDAVDYPGRANSPMTTETLSTNIALGTAPTTNISSLHANSSNANGSTGRILSFPNWIQVRPRDCCHIFNIDLGNNDQSTKCWA